MLEAAALKRPWPTLETPDLTVPPGMRREQFRAMGTTISLLLPEHRANVGTEAVRSLFAQWEQTLSRFRPESELSQLNAHAGSPMAVNPLLYDVVETALQAARATDGLFDPTLLRQLVVAGYDRSFETLSHRLPRALTVPGPGGAWREIQMDAASGQVTLPPGSGLDLGGIAKGMAVDAALERLQDLDIAAALVNAGGDLAVYGSPAEGSDWPIAVPTRHGTYTVALRHGAVATSGIGRRRWRQGPEQRHHLLDPRTGQPAHGLWSVSVGAQRCVQAEVAAKVACILGPEAGARFLTDNGLSGLLVRQDGICETASGWPVPADGECV
jgi:thiamine biosynthesis lipoprotein